MFLRDLAVILIVLAGCLYTLRKPYIGILLWSWLSYMNPHRLSWGFAYTMPFAYITALVLMISMLVNSRQAQKLPINSLTLIWLLFIVLMGLSTLQAYFPEDAWVQYVRIIKIQLIVFLTMLLVTDINKLNQLIWVVVLSIGYFTIKGGVFTLLTGGSYRVWGPPESFIEGNNELAVAALMVIPLMAYLRSIQSDWWIRQGLLAGMGLNLISAIGSQSRGALIAFAAVGLFFWFKSEKKLVGGIVITLMTLGLIVFMPDSWHERMDTIQTYEQDASAMGRLNAWEYAINAANHNLLGVGLDSWSGETFALYAPDPYDVHAAHSIYFSVLADHGWIGLIMFLLIFYLSWFKLKQIIKKTNDTDQKDLNSLAKMLQVSFIAYWVGGAFLSLSYFDLPWHLVSFVVLVEGFLKRRIDSRTNSQKSMAQ